MDEFMALDGRSTAGSSRHWPRQYRHSRSHVPRPPNLVPSLDDECVPDDPGPN